MEPIEWLMVATSLVVLISVITVFSKLMDTCAESIAHSVLSERQRRLINGHITLIRDMSGYPIGSRYWLNGSVLHCIYGPAIEDVLSGYREWWEHGKRVKDVNYLMDYDAT